MKQANQPLQDRQGASLPVIDVADLSTSDAGRRKAVAERAQLGAYLNREVDAVVRPVEQQRAAAP